MHNFRYRWCMILMFGLSLPGAPHANAGPIKEHGRHRPEHSLVGQIWDARAARFISAQDFYPQIEQADFVLLGETHTNPYHHRLQRRVIDHMVADGRRPAVVFEMFERDNQPTIERMRSHYPHDANRIARETHMEDRGWPWRLYKPLVETVVTYGLPLFGADMSQSTVRKIVMKGLTAIDATRINALALNAPLAPRAAATMRKDIAAAHCGHAPELLIDGMVAAQRARDASLADGLIKHADRHGAVLIAGSGHVRDDFAAPAYLRRRAPHKTILSVGFMDVAGDKRDPASYAASTNETSPAYDYLWFTQSHQAPDPCKQFEENLRTLDRMPAPR